jgi:Mg2+ and Co2+ transporter CorA
MSQAKQNLVLNFTTNLQSEMQKIYDSTAKARKELQKLQKQCNSLGKASFAKKLTGELGKVKDAISSTSAKVKEETEKMKDQCNSIAKSDFSEKLANSLGKVKDAMSGIAANAATFLKSSLDSAIKAEEVNDDLAQTIKATKGAAGETVQSISNMASKFSSLTTYSEETIKSGQNVLLTYDNMGKNVFPQATSAMLDMATGMKSDIPKTAKKLGEALNEPIRGVTQLQSAGVKFSKSQKDVIQKLAKTGQTAAAQKLIIAELNKQFGGQAQSEANTYSGKLQQMQNAFNSVKVAIGTELLPHMTKFVTSLSGVVMKVINFIKENKTLVTGVLVAVTVFGSLIGGLSTIKNVLGILSPVAEALGVTLGSLAIPIIALVAGITLFTVAYSKNLGGFKTFINNLVKQIQKHSDTVKLIFSMIAGGFAAFCAYTIIYKAIGALKGFKLALQSISISPVMIGVIAIGALIGALIYLWNTNKGFKTFVIGLLNSIKSTAGNVFKFISNVINGVGAVVGKAGKFMLGKFKDISTCLKEHKNVIKAVAVVLGAVFAPALIGTGVQAAIAGAKITAHFVSGIAKAGLQSVINGAKIKASFIKTLITSGIEAVKSGAKVTLKFVGSLITTGAQAAITAAKFTGKLIIAMVQYAASGWKAVAAAGAQAGKFVAQKAAIIASTVATKAAAVGQWLLNAAINANPIGLLVIGVAALVAGFILLYKHCKPLRDAIKGLWDGMKKGAEVAINFVIEGINKLIKLMNHIPGIHIKALSKVDFTSKGKSKAGINGSHANGLSYVPFNGYIAELHKGERVLTANETRNYNADSSRTQKSITIAKLADTIVVREDADIDKIADRLARKLELTSLNMGV